MKLARKEWLQAAQLGESYIVSPSVFNDMNDVDRLLAALPRI